MTERIELPPHVREVVRTLRRAGFEAWAVGGCVRDSLLGLVPHDWDICTDAPPDETLRVFARRRTYTVGSRHGTVGVNVDGHVVEVTTFREDGSYSDNRRPDSVQFVRSLREDLARRDFTINAMAYCDEEGLVDPFGGRADLRAGVIRCVGEPELRFTEDALRILRALRFAARYGFQVEARTAAAAKEKRALLGAVSVERIFEELRGILIGPGAGGVLRGYSGIFLSVLPELEGRTDWAIAARGVDAQQPDFVLRFALLLIPAGIDGARSVLTRLRCDNKSSQEILALIERADVPLPGTKAQMRRLLSQVGQEQLQRMLQLKTAQATALCEQEPDEVRFALELAKMLMAEEGRITLRALAVGGGDILSLGVARGPAVGKILNVLLDRVLDGELPNERALLLQAARVLAESKTAQNVD